MFKGDPRPSQFINEIEGLISLEIDKTIQAFQASKKQPGPDTV
jgi:hypothetical protein